MGIMFLYVVHESRNLYQSKGCERYRNFFSLFFIILYFRYSMINNLMLQCDTVVMVNLLSVFAKDMHLRLWSTVKVNWPYLRLDNCPCVRDQLSRMSRAIYRSHAIGPLCNS